MALSAAYAETTELTDSVTILTLGKNIRAKAKDVVKITDNIKTANIITDPSFSFILKFI